MRFRLYFKFFIFAAVLTLSREAAYAQQPAPDPEQGRQAYLDNCTRCHGPTGAGDGRDAQRMYPHPRKLSEGVFKFRTTASGTPPTDEDLYNTISEGLPGSRMPDFQRLPEDIRWQLVYYVKGLSPAFQDQKPEPLKFGTDPGPGRANLGKGKELYTKLGCNACHGNLGRGNGPSAATLVDQWGAHIDPADLTQGWNYRGGSAPRDVLVRLMTGIDGTPMPSYAEAVKPEEVWDLAYYVHSLQAQPQWKREVEAVKAPGVLPAGLEDKPWEKAPRTDLALTATFYRGGEIAPSAVRAVSVQAMYNESEILFRLSWHDRTESRENVPDAAGLAFLEDPDLRWSAGSLRAWPAKTGGPQPAVAYWSAASGNAPEGVSPLEAAARYDEGEWTLLARRPLQGKKPAGFGILVWDGGNSEEGRHRSNSSWVKLIFKD